MTHFDVVLYTRAHWQLRRKRDRIMNNDAIIIIILYVQLSYIGWHRDGIYYVD